MFRSSLLCMLLALCGCGPAGGDGESAAQAAPRPDAPAASPAQAAEHDPDDPVAGLWWIFAPSFPIRAFRVSLEPAREGETTPGTWVTFDWRSTSEQEALQRRSKPVRIGARFDRSLLVLEGPTPMLTESGRPNGQIGSWTISLRRSELPGEPPRWTGTAVHDRGLTGPEGVPAEMERSFRRWQ